MVEDCNASQFKGEVLPITKEWVDVTRLVTGFGSNLVRTHRGSLPYSVAVADSLLRVATSLRERDRPEFFLRDLTTFRTLPFEVFNREIPLAADIYGMADPEVLSRLTAEAHDIWSGELVGQGRKHFTRDSVSSNSFRATFIPGHELQLAQHPGGVVAASIADLDDLAYPIYAVEAVTSPVQPVAVTLEASSFANSSFIDELNRHVVVTDQLYPEVASIIGHLSQGSFQTETPINPNIMFNFLVNTVSKYLYSKISK